MMPLAAAHVHPTSSPGRAFGRFALTRLLGKSDATMTWLALDTRSSIETMLTMPRVAPSGQAAAERWLLGARRAARLDHPDLATVAEFGVHEHWPFVAVDRRAGITLDEWLAQHPRPAIEDAALWIGAVLRGLAFAHEAGVVHLDPQCHNILVNERGQASVMALAAAHPGSEWPETAPARASDPSSVAPAPSSLRAQRTAAERDVLACGVLLHRLLAAEPALGSADVSRVIDRMAPLGRELVRLPWMTPLPIPEALRAIVNRSTSGQPRLRYRNARTFLGALNGWHDAVSQEEGGPVALLLDRLRTVGHLPALPGLATRVQRVTNIESQRTDEIARHLLPDMALSFELLRTLNSAQVQGTQVSGNGPVLTLRRVVALIGVNGVRAAANSLRTWPGPLDEQGASLLRTAIDRVRLAGHAAQALRPAGYDPEVVYLVAVLQNLGRLLLRYHFPDEAEQIHQLMQPAAGTPLAGESTAPEQPGLSEEAAAFAVLGVDVEAFGTAAARYWGLGDDVLHMIRRLPIDVPVRKPDGDADVLRIVASAANEAIEALHLPASKVALALNEVVLRYARTLRLTTRVLHDGLQEARDSLRQGGTLPSAGRGRVEEVPDATNIGAAADLPVSSAATAAPSGAPGPAA
jgi:non-specific serine/threonine protein kinase